MNNEVNIVSEVNSAITVKGIDNANDYAEIDATGTVVNIIRLLEPTILHTGNITVLSPGNGVSIGWKYENGQFIDPNPPIISQPPPLQPSTSDLHALIIQLQAQVAALTPP
jgi:hypothetical protein